MVKAKKKSNKLSDEIYSLLAPELPSNADPEDQFDASAHIDEDLDDDYIDDTAVSSKGFGKGGLKMRAPVDLGEEDPMYRGKRVSAKKIFNAFSSDEEEDDDEDEDAGKDDFDDDDDDEDDFDDDDDDEMFDDDDDDDEDEDDYNSSEEEEEDYSSSKKKKVTSSKKEQKSEKKKDGKKKKSKKEVSSSDDDDEEDDLDEIEKEQDAAIMRLARTDSKEVEMSKNAANQQMMIDTVLESRIVLQRALANANRLPQPPMFEAFCRENKATAEGLEKCRVVARSTVLTLMALQQALAENVADVPSLPLISQESLDKKRKRNEADSDLLWSEIQLYEHSLTPYRDAAIDQWNRKAQLATAGYSQKFNTLNQTVLAQVKALMRDKDRLVQRTRQKRTNYRVIGKPAEPEKAAPVDVDKVADEERPADNIEYDDEIFDDTDFYQIMLRDLIESVGASRAAEDTMALREQLRQARKKRRGQVDTKASKGRKLRFAVQPKLVNFMFSKDDTVPAYAAELFSNLFGKRQQQQQLKKRIEEDEEDDE